MSTQTKSKPKTKKKKSNTIAINFSATLKKLSNSLTILSPKIWLKSTNAVLKRIYSYFTLATLKESAFSVFSFTKTVVTLAGRGLFVSMFAVVFLGLPFSRWMHHGDPFLLDNSVFMRLPNFWYTPTWYTQDKDADVVSLERQETPSLGARFRRLMGWEDTYNPKFWREMEKEEEEEIRQMMEKRRQQQSPNF